MGCRAYSTVCARPAICSRPRGTGGRGVLPHSLLGSSPNAACWLGLRPPCAPAPLPSPLTAGGSPVLAWSRSVGDGVSLPLCGSACYPPSRLLAPSPSPTYLFSQQLWPKPSLSREQVPPLPQSLSPESPFPQLPILPGQHLPLSPPEQGIGAGMSGGERRGVEGKGGEGRGPQWLSCCSHLPWGLCSQSKPSHLLWATQRTGLRAHGL